MLANLSLVRTVRLRRPAAQLLLGRHSEEWV